jgi:RNA polymerase sigma-70 factor (ECF subfamily)
VAACCPGAADPGSGYEEAVFTTAGALAAVDRLEDMLAGYHAYHVTRADLLRRLGRNQKRAAYDRAIELAGNTAETAYLRRRRDELA